MKIILVLFFAWFPMKIKIRTLEWDVCTVQRRSWEDLFLLVPNSKINRHLMKKEIAHLKAIILGLSAVLDCGAHWHMEVLIIIESLAKQWSTGAVSSVENFKRGSSSSSKLKFSTRF